MANCMLCSQEEEMGLDHLGNCESWYNIKILGSMKENNVIVKS